MRLGPDEVRVGEADLGEALEFLEADREELLRFWARENPLAGGREEALAVATERY